MSWQETHAVALLKSVVCAWVDVVIVVHTAVARLGMRQSCAAFDELKVEPLRTFSSGKQFYRVLLWFVQHGGFARFYRNAPWPWRCHHLWSDLSGFERFLKLCL